MAMRRFIGFSFTARWLLCVFALLLGLVVPIHAIGSSPCASDDVTAIQMPVNVSPVIQAFIVAHRGQGPPEAIDSLAFDHAAMESQSGSSWRLFVFSSRTTGHSATFIKEAFGGLLTSNGTTPNRFFYCGEMRNGAMGLDYLRARWMNTDGGRFVTADTFEGALYSPDTLHRYLYCSDNPVDRVDPSGYAWTSSPQLGYEAEEVIEERYDIDHIMDTVQYGRWTRLYGGIGLFRAKPDILNTSALLYAEIKPLSISGVAAGAAQMAARSLQFRYTGYSPDTSWVPSSHYGVTRSGEKIVFFNAGGLIFYFSASANVQDLLAVCAGKKLSPMFVNVLTRTWVGLSMRLPAFVGLSTGASTARMQVGFGTAMLLASFGFVL